MAGGSAAWRWILPATVLALVAACACAAGPDPHRGATTVPWAALPLQPPSGAAHSPVSAPPCRAAQLAGARGPDAGLTGQQLALDFVLWDHGATACRVSGSPSLRLTSATGAALPVSLQTGLSQLADGMGPAQPVLLRAGQSGPGPLGAPLAGEADLVVIWSPVLDDGPDCPGARPVAAEAQVGVAGGVVPVGLVPAAGQLETPFAPCEGIVGVGRFQPSGAAPSPSPAPTLLGARLVAPGRVRAGSVLHFRVVLRNASRTRIDLTRRCAGYSASASASGYLVKEAHQLNCAAAGSIPAGGSRTFAMELATRRSRISRRLRLSWSLLPGADLALSDPSGAQARVRLLASGAG